MNYSIGQNGDIQYLIKNQKILFATPCYGGQIFSKCAMSYLKLSDTLTKNDIPHEIKFFDNVSLITKGRNIACAHFMVDDSFTHLMFIDADIVFHPKTFLLMLSHDKPLSGCTYPAKNIIWHKEEVY